MSDRHLLQPFVHHLAGLNGVELGEDVLELIRKKQEGQAIVAPLPRQPRGEVLDLMDALKRSLEHSAGKKKEPIKATSKEKPRRQRKAS